MSKLEVLTFPNEILSQKAKPINNIDNSIKKLSQDMVETMYESKGVGLAAPQVGISQKIIVYESSLDYKNKEPKVLINPKIVSFEGEIISKGEACLSVLDYSCDVKRYSQVTVEGLDINGKKLTFDAKDMQAIILQHEIDHLNGILFIDKISSLKRALYKKKLKKILKKK